MASYGNGVLLYHTPAAGVSRGDSVSSDSPLAQRYKWLRCWACAYFRKFPWEVLGMWFSPELWLEGHHWYHLWQGQVHTVLWVTVTALAEACGPAEKLVSTLRRVPIISPPPLFIIHSFTVRTSGNSQRCPRSCVRRKLGFGAEELDGKCDRGFWVPTSEACNSNHWGERYLWRKPVSV